jgi:hypothetical protein
MFVTGSSVVDDRDIVAFPDLVLSDGDGWMVVAVVIP